MARIDSIFLSRVLIASATFFLKRLKSWTVRAIFEEILQDSMFNFPSEKNIEKVVVDENVVKNKEQPLKLLRKKIAN